jgi:hypothetical protein
VGGCELGRSGSGVVTVVVSRVRGEGQIGPNSEEIRPQLVAVVVYSGTVGVSASGAS